MHCIRACYSLNFTLRSQITIFTPVMIIHSFYMGFQ